MHHLRTRVQDADAIARLATGLTTVLGAVPADRALDVACLVTAASDDDCQALQHSSKRPTRATRTRTAQGSPHVDLSAPGTHPQLSPALQTPSPQTGGDVSNARREAAGARVCPDEAGLGDCLPAACCCCPAGTGLAVSRTAGSCGCCVSAGLADGLTAAFCGSAVGAGFSTFRRLAACMAA